MVKIDFSDIIFVTVLQQGRSLAQLTFSGLHSIKELMQRLRQSLHQYNGLLTIQLRNSTQGWSKENQMLFAA